MSSRVAQRHAAGSYDSCDSRVSASGRLITLVAALMIALATLFVGIAMPRQASAADEGVGLGMVVSLAMLSFLAVFREGAETVIFYESIYSMSRDAQGMWIGGIAAGVVLLVIFLVLRFTSVKIPIGPFFLVTSILMAVLVVIFAGGGIHALIEGDLIDGHYLSSVPTNDWIGLYPYVECLAAQAIAAIAVLALFAVGFARKRKLRTPDNRK